MLVKGTVPVPDHPKLNAVVLFIILCHAFYLIYKYCRIELNVSQCRELDAYYRQIAQKFIMIILFGVFLIFNKIRLFAEPAYSLSITVKKTDSESLESEVLFSN